jgi:hypothetical protein
MIKKIIIFSLLAFLSYKGLGYYFVYSSSKKLITCPTVSKVMQLKEKQNFAEAHFFKIPDAWLNPSIEYVNPPFTEDELNQEVVVIDEAMKRDLLAFRSIFSAEILEELELSSPDIKTAKTEEVERHYQRKITILKELISKLREFKPDSIKMTTLKTQMAYSLSLIVQNTSEAIKLTNYTNKQIAKGDSLLSLPKDQLKLHREELIRISSEMDILYAKLQDTIVKDEQYAKEIRKTADEINELARIHS